MKKRRGFTLLELMIVVAVIAVLATIALSSYSKQIRKSRRAEAKQVLSDLGLKDEKWRAYHKTYGSIASIGGAATSSFYTIALASNATSQTAYTFTATPTGDQLKDSCGTLTLQMNIGTLNKLPTTTGCWQ